MNYQTYNYVSNQNVILHYVKPTHYMLHLPNVQTGTTNRRQVLNPRHKSRLVKQLIKPEKMPNVLVKIAHVTSVVQSTMTTQPLAVNKCKNNIPGTSHIWNRWFDSMALSAITFNTWTMNTIPQAVIGYIPMPNVIYLLVMFIYI